MSLILITINFKGVLHILKATVNLSISTKQMSDFLRFLSLIYILSVIKST